MMFLWKVIFSKQQMQSLTSKLWSMGLFGYHLHVWVNSVGLPLWLRWSRNSLQCSRLRCNPWVGKIPWRRKRQFTPVFLPREFQGQRGLEGYSPWGCKESDETERLHLILGSMNSGIPLFGWKKLLLKVGLGKWEERARPREAESSLRSSTRRSWALGQGP